MRGPHGETVVCPKREDIERMLSQSADYWTDGDAAVSLGDDCAALIFWKDEGQGVFIMRLDDYHAPFDAAKETRVVYHTVGGEAMAVPSSCYVTECQAAEILVAYLETGAAPDTFEWKDIYEIIEP